MGNGIALKLGEETVWVKARTERVTDEGNPNRFFKTVTIESNPFEKVIVQPWLEGILF